MRKYWRILLLGALVSGAAIAMIASQIDFALLLEALQTADYAPFFLACIVTIIGLAARAVRWRVLLSGGLPLGRSFHILNIAYFVNGLIPLRIGEVARMWLASRGERGVPVFKSAGTIVVERLLDLLTVVLFIAVGLAISDSVPDLLRDTAGFMGVLALSGFLLLVFFSARRDLAHKPLNLALRLLPFLNRLNLKAWLDHLLDGFKPLSHPRSLASALLWTAISWAFSLVSAYLLMLVFYDEGDWVATLLFVAAASFAVAFPAVPGNIGPYEWSIIATLGALGYWTAETPEAYATATATAIIVHFMNLLVNAVLGVFGMLAEGVSLAQVSEGVQQMREEPEEEPAQQVGLT